MIKKHRIRYRKYQTAAVFDKIGACLACREKGRTEMHHYKYKYKTSEVRKNHQLAAENIVELCYNCHRLADAYRKIMIGRMRSLLVMEVLIKKMGGKNVRTNTCRSRNIPNCAG